MGYFYVFDGGGGGVLNWQCHDDIFKFIFKHSRHSLSVWGLFKGGSIVGISRYSSLIKIHKPYVSTLHT